MPRRRITRTLGIAAGGLLGFAIVPAAAAFADSYEIIPDPSSTETLTGVYGLENTAPPTESGSIQGYQEFQVLDTTTGQAVGYFDADESNSTDAAGDTNTVLLVTADVPGTGTVGTAAGDVPPVGSVIDTYNYAGDEIGYVYSAFSSTGGTDTISDILTTVGYGDFNVGSTYDAITAESGVTSLPDMTLSDGDVIEPVSGSTEQVIAISGAPPYDMAVQGTQEFELLNSAGTEIGTFDADVTTTTDAAGTTTEALLVTSDGTGAVGTGAADLPAVGSVFNMIDYDDGAYPEVYSDLVSSAGNVISFVDYTGFGTFTIPITFDAAAADTDAVTSVPFGSDYTIDPADTETLTGINGLPPADVAIQGTQDFNVENASGDVVGSFDADVTNTSSSVYDETTETILVTSEGTGTVGTAAGDVPAVGSVIDVANYGSGFETVYADLISSTGTNVITDTMVTPFGDFALPTSFDATSGLLADTIALF